MAAEGVRRGPVGPRGFTGERGPQGEAGQAFTYDQTVPANIWTITHNFGRPPAAVTLYDTSGNAFDASWRVLDDNTIEVHMLPEFAQAGKAVLE